MHPPVLASLPVCLLFTTLALPAAAQRSEAPAQRPLPAPPPVIVPPAAADLRGPIVPLAISQEAPLQRPADLDDAVPAPRRLVPIQDADGERFLDVPPEDPEFLGFASGRYYPPKGERIDPALVASLGAAASHGRPTPTVYAFAMLSRRITDERQASFEALGARVLGVHPHNCLKLAFAPEDLSAIAGHPDLRWIGLPRPEQKRHPLLAAHLANAGADPVQVYVSTYESDLSEATVFEPVGSASRVDPGTAPLPEPVGSSAQAMRVVPNGWQQRALEAAGAEVLDYADGVRAFKLLVTPARLERIVAMDFVQFVEPVVPAGALHDNSTPMIGTDIVRNWATGGASQTVVAGQIDSGLDHAHADLSHTYIVGWELGGTGGAFNDVCEHGSHVGGTLHGTGGIEPWLRGNAPGLGYSGSGRYFNVKTSDACTNWSFSLSTALSVLGTSYWDGVSTTPRPHVVNNSWGGGKGGFIGSEAEARMLDDQVYGGQMYVFAAGNWGPNANTLTVHATAKNVFTVGSVSDYTTPGSLPGEISSFSSRGPTGDGRWKPNVVAVGESVESVDANSGTGHTFKLGTSMATPHVTGLAAQLMDNLTYLQGVPERAESVLMATALTRNLAPLTTPQDAHLDSYGTGRVDAFRANYGTSADHWANWGAYLPSNTQTGADFYIAPGATRMVVCLTWVESSASAGASFAVDNDLDLYIDAPPISPGGNTGEYTLQQSAFDNTEIRVLSFPASGTWRWKIWPYSAPKGSYYGVTVAVSYSDTYPTLAVTTTPQAAFLRPYESTDVVVDVYNPSYVASAALLETDYATGGGWAYEVKKVLGDGISTGSVVGGPNAPLILGSIPAGYSRRATYRTGWSTEGFRSFKAYAKSENSFTGSGAGVVIVDGTPPPLVTNLKATTHTPGVWSNKTLAGFSWTEQPDALSGLLGHSFATSNSGPGTVYPPLAVSLPAGTAGTTLQFTSSSTGWYFGIRSADQLPNWSGVVETGPYLIDNVAPGAVSSLVSTSHTPSTPSCQKQVVMTWNEAPDAHSGVAGYVAFFDQQPTTQATTSTTNVAQGVGTYQQTLSVSGTGWYFHIAAVDQAGNRGPTSHKGPYLVSNPTITTYCTAKVNSLGCTPSIGSTGSPLASSTSGFTVTCANVRNNKSGLLFYSFAGAASTPYQGGTLCMGTPIRRTPVVNAGGSPTGQNCSGVYSIDMAAFAHGALGGTPHPSLTQAGTVVRCQWWGRDTGASFGTTLSNALTYTICN